LYLGSGIGLWLWRRWQRATKVHLPPGERLWLAGAIVAGDVVGPVLLMIGLSAMQAAGTDRAQQPRQEACGRDEDKRHEPLDLPPTTIIDPCQCRAPGSTQVPGMP